MKRLLLFLVPVAFAVSCSNPPAKQQAAAKMPVQNDSVRTTPANANTLEPVDISPMDISYFPVDYPIHKMETPALPPPLARVIYSRPHKQGRAIFGNLLKWGERWRLGANEATELELFANATIAGKKVKSGRYVLYAVPQPDSWTIYFNRNTFSWGLKQDTTQNNYTFNVPSAPTPTPFEFYTMVFQKTAAGADLVMAWDHTWARLPISF